MRARVMVWPAAIVVLVAVAAVLANLGDNVAEGRTSFLNDFKARYPAVVGTRLDSCGTCHLDWDGGGTLNAYGEAYLSSGLAAIESADSDGDGTSNLNEINALFMPGLSCATYTDAINAPVDLVNYVDPLRPACTVTTPTPTASPTPTPTRHPRLRLRPHPRLRPHHAVPDTHATR
jgi:hypothetical protein